jgi:hypothetical protein
MLSYYRALPNPIVSQQGRHVRNYHDRFVWVPNLKDATTDYRPAAEQTQAKQKAERCIAHIWRPNTFFP